MSSEAAVVDDRRHNEASSSDCLASVVLNRSANVSFRDIHERATRLLSDGDAIPSLHWMEYQFWPKDARLRSAVNYTGRFKVTMAAQSAQLRKSHPDQMIGHVEFKYLKTLAVRHRDVTDMICGDDKHKVCALLRQSSMKALSAPDLSDGASVNEHRISGQCWRDGFPGRSGSQNSTRDRW